MSTKSGLRNWLKPKEFLSRSTEDNRRQQEELELQLALKLSREQYEKEREQERAALEVYASQKDAQELELARQIAAPCNNSPVPNAASRSKDQEHVFLELDLSSPHEEDEEHFYSADQKCEIKELNLSETPNRPKESPLRFSDHYFDDDEYDFESDPLRSSPPSPSLRYFGNDCRKLSYQWEEEEEEEKEEDELEAFMQSMLTSGTASECPSEPSSSRRAYLHSSPPTKSLIETSTASAYSSDITSLNEIPRKRKSIARAVAESEMERKRKQACYASHSNYYALTDDAIASELEGSGFGETTGLAWEGRGQSRYM
ncbi:hypothetical protein BX666DRAFT_221382 [Dichotomocladium elegans]|nr:hypothetical protein BX666DRAFT_221382 [Dichotomocladium elegans]